MGVALLDFRLEVVFGLGQFSLHLTTHGWNLLGKLKELTLATNVKILGENYGISLRTVIIILL